jgi:hypothetical protein
MADKPASLWRIPLAREIAVILLIKLILLFAIKIIWFDAATTPKNGVQRMDQQFFGASARRTSPLSPSAQEH